MTDIAHKWWPPNGFVARWILEQFPEGYRGHAIDVGASDGMSVNTTFPLEKAHFWTVVSVEANPDWYPYLVPQRAMVEKCACGSESGEADFHLYLPHVEAYSSLRPNRKKAEGPGPWQSVPWKTIRVPVKTVDEILDRWEFPKLDALCIDVEGTELDVLRGFDIAEWLPKVVIAESWEEPVEIDAYLKPHGYKRSHKSVDNHLWTRP